MKLYSSAYNVWPADDQGRLDFITGLVGFEWLGGLELGYADSLAWPAGAPSDLPAIVSGVPDRNRTAVCWLPRASNRTCE